MTCNSVYSFLCLRSTTYLGAWATSYFFLWIPWYILCFAWCSTYHVRPTFTIGQSRIFFVHYVFCFAFCLSYSFHQTGNCTAPYCTLLSTLGNMTFLQWWTHPSTGYAWTPSFPTFLQCRKRSRQMAVSDSRRRKGDTQKPINWFTQKVTNKENPDSGYFNRVLTDMMKTPTQGLFGVQCTSSKYSTKLMIQSAEQNNWYTRTIHMLGRKNTHTHTQPDTFFWNNRTVGRDKQRANYINKIYQTFFSIIILHLNVRSAKLRICTLRVARQHLPKSQLAPTYTFFSY